MIKLKTLMVACVLSSSVIAPVVAYAAEDSQTTGFQYDVRDVLDKLSDSLVIHDEIPTLEKSKLLGRDQASANNDLNESLDDLMDVFDSEKLKALREQYRRLEDKIAEEEGKQQEYRSEKVLASRDERSLRTKLLPGETLKSMVAVSKADYEMLIETSETNISEYHKELSQTLVEMRTYFSEIGLSLSTEQIDVLMSSVVGDDILKMSVVFNAIKDVTLKLEELTNQTGESLEHAKKYYGMVVVLYKLMDRMQTHFIAEIDNNYLPKLQGFKETAQSNIKESQKLISKRVNVKTLKNNVESNELTLKVIALYKKVLMSQRDKVFKANDLTKKEMAVADNTYKTVSLSSAVSGLISDGANNFGKLISLQIPDVREFQNQKIKEEFKLLSQKLEG
ncbi:hypothetical protein ACIGBN_06620 [Marinomonas sp. NPDC078689]|uniref:hypothetical protein n=1 Tax=Marinomonas sp. NPDC078689 TaxID=3364147 RepID=UPI0037C5A0F3